MDFLGVPTSFNTKTGEEVRILQFHHYRYTMRYLQQFMNDALMVNLEDLQEPLSKSEMEAIVKSTFKAYKGHREDISKGYNYKNETLINLLAITEEEQQQLQTIISKREKLDRKAKYYRESRRSEDGLTNRQKAKEQNVKQIKLLFEQGIKKAQIAKELNVSRAYVTQVLNSHKKKK